MNAMVQYLFFLLLKLSYYSFQGPSFDFQIASKEVGLMEGYLIWKQLVRAARIYFRSFAAYFVKYVLHRSTGSGHVLPQLFVMSPALPMAAIVFCVMHSYSFCFDYIVMLFGVQADCND